jgi:hypothetical protein
MIKKSIETEADHGVLEELQRGGMDGRWLRYCGVGCYVSFFLNCAYYTDYHWDRHLYFVILSLMHRLYSLLLTYLDSGYDSILLLILVVFGL